jgi:hypothetical protein
LWPRTERKLEVCGNGVWIIVWICERWTGARNVETSTTRIYSSVDLLNRRSRKLWWNDFAICPLIAKQTKDITFLRIILLEHVS